MAQKVKVNSQLCSFCNMEPETIEHLFFICIYLQNNIGLYVFQEWLDLSGSCHVGLPNLRIDSCVFGVNNEVEYSKAVNTIIILVRIYVFLLLFVCLFACLRLLGFCFWEFVCLGGFFFFWGGGFGGVVR